MRQFRLTEALIGKSAGDLFEYLDKVCLGARHGYEDLFGTNWHNDDSYLVH